MLHDICRQSCCERMAAVDPRYARAALALAVIHKPRPSGPYYIALDETRSGQLIWEGGACCDAAAREAALDALIENHKRPAEFLLRCISGEAANLFGIYSSKAAPFSTAIGFVACNRIDFGRVTAMASGGIYVEGQSIFGAARALVDMLSRRR